MDSTISMQEVEAMTAELRLLRHENKMLLKALGQMRKAMEKMQDKAGENDDSKAS